MTIQTENATETHTTEERDWIAAAKRGDKVAFGRIVRRYHRLVVNVAYRLSGDAGLADDVAQETFLAAWQHLAGFTPEGENSLRSWLCRIVHNRTMDVLRRERRLTSLEDWRPDPDPSPLDLAQQSETGAIVQAAILRLPKPARAALVLREFEGLTYAEIGDVLEIPIGTVMSRLHTARRRLAKELAPQMRSGVEHEPTSR